MYCALKVLKLVAPLRETLLVGREPSRRPALDLLCFSRFFSAGQKAVNIRFSDLEMNLSIKHCHN